MIVKRTPFHFASMEASTIRSYKHSFLLQCPNAMKHNRTCLSLWSISFSLLYLFSFFEIKCISCIHIRTRRCIGICSAYKVFLLHIWNIRITGISITDRTKVWDLNTPKEHEGTAQMFWLYKIHTITESLVSQQIRPGIWIRCGTYTLYAHEWECNAQWMCAHVTLYETPLTKMFIGGSCNYQVFILS